MHTVVIKHVALSELPADWRNRLHVAQDAHVTVRIEEEAEPAAQTAVTDNPLFGMWQDREETTDVAAYARQLREPRYNIDGSRHND